MLLNPVAANQAVCTWPAPAIPAAGCWTGRLGRGLRRTGLAAVLLASLGVSAAPLEPGVLLPTLALSDQHDKPLALGLGTKQLLFAADKAASDRVNEVLSAQEPGFVGRNGIAYVADISAMPAMVTRMFALPKLRALPFPVGLVRDAALTAALPRQPGQVTVLDLDQGVITRIRHAADAQALRLALGLAPQ